MEDTRVIHDPEKGKEKGYGFVLFVHKNSLQKSLIQGNNHVIQGYELECRQTMLREEMNNEEENEQNRLFEEAYLQKEREYERRMGFLDEQRNMDSEELDIVPLGLSSRPSNINASQH